MNEKKNLTAPPKRTVSYTIKNPVIPPTSRRNAPPPIGPEIGPDPRSSIGARISMAEYPLFNSESGILYKRVFDHDQLLLTLSRHGDAQGQLHQGNESSFF